MGNMFDMMKKAASMQREMKKLQKELARATVEASDGAVTVVASCDMAVKSVKIDAEQLPALLPAALERMVASAVNKALQSAKKKAGDSMGRISGGLGGLSDLLGGS